LTLIAGEEYFDATVISESQALLPRHSVRNTFLFGRRLLWQRRALPHVIGARTVIFELNPRILSTWVALLARRVLHRPSVVWGHANSRSRVSRRRGLVGE